MVHKRSQQSIVRRFAIANARRDRELGETICVTTSYELSNAVKKEYGYVDQHVINLAPGDILTDSRGRGLLQKVPAVKNKLKMVCARNGRTFVIPVVGR